MHTRLSARVSKDDLAMDFGQGLRDHIISPLVMDGAAGVDKAVSNMLDYSLLRSDLDSIMKVTQWPDKPDAMMAVASQIKASLTRKMKNKGSLLPYNTANIVSKGKGGEYEDSMHSKEEDTSD